ncbi:MAG: hypothetical protein FWD83_02720 [Promicromonosporaceae bacterium]|nr:hypothetical protein [Promicromonosporaceae bacterium]
MHRQLDADHYFSHATAALIWGLRRWRPPDTLHLIQHYRPSAQAAKDLTRHFVTLNDADLDVRHGLPVTSLVRTVVDCALTMHPLEGLVIADHAVALGLDLAVALQHLDRRGAVRGRSQARRVLEWADPGAESQWESWLRYILLRVGFPRPETQYVVETRLGPYRVDFAWPEFGLLVEFDGQVKYRDGGLGVGYDADVARICEKRRQNAIEEVTGRSLLRVMAMDHPDEVVARLAARLPEPVAKSLHVVSGLAAVPSIRASNR